ncbi:MAG: hypothetical protein AB7U61_16000 [Methylocystis sp.]
MAHFPFHSFLQRTFYVAGWYQFGETKGEPGLCHAGNEGAWLQPAAWNFE